ncbi:MAG: glycosyltransferase family 2 protein, partial [Bacteroidaceae bacterium]
EIKTNLKKLQSKEPIVSVVVIAHNEETRLLSCLWSLSESKCKYPMEIIGVNNNSDDQTEQIYQAVGLPYFNELQKSCGYARKCGLEHAKGLYYICIDSDTMYPSKYVETMVNELTKPGVVGVSSLWSYIPDKDHPWWGLKIYEFTRDSHLFFQSFKRPELSVRGLVFAYEIEYGRKVGYRVDIIRGEDGSMALGLKQYGKIHFVRNRKARAVTGYGTVSADGTFFNSFKNRVLKGIKNFASLFYSKKEYKDENTNLIK